MATTGDYRRLSTLRDDLRALVDEYKNYPLISLMEIVEALIEWYESEQESMEHEIWYSLSIETLARAYGDDEPEYTTDMLNWMNPDYEGK